MWNRFVLWLLGWLVPEEDDGLEVFDEDDLSDYRPFSR